MKPEQQKELKEHLQAIAKILYAEADPDSVQSLEGIEKTIRTQTLEYITPEIGFFLLKKQQEQPQEELKQ